MIKSGQYLMFAALLLGLAGCAAPTDRSSRDAESESAEIVCQERPAGTGSRLKRPICRPAEP